MTLRELISTYVRIWILSSPGGVAPSCEQVSRAFPWVHPANIEHVMAELAEMGEGDDG